MLTLIGQGIPTLLGSDPSCSNYLFNFLFVVISITTDFLKTFATVKWSDGEKEQDRQGHFLQIFLSTHVISFHNLASREWMISLSSFFILLGVDSN